MKELSYEEKEQRREAYCARYAPVLRLIVQRIEQDPKAFLLKAGGCVHIHADLPHDRTVDDLLSQLCDAAEIDALELYGFAMDAAKPIPKAEPKRPATKTVKARTAKAAATRGAKPKPATKPAKKALRAMSQAPKKTASPRRAAALAAALTDEDKEILKFAKSQGPIQVGDVMTSFSLGRSQAAASLKRLVRAGELKIEGQRRHAKYKATDGAAKQPQLPGMADAATDDDDLDTDE